MSDLPFQAEYAKSGRASCKACKDTIAKDSLRLAIMVQSPHFDGKVPNWFHFKCFWKRAKVSSTKDIQHFDSLRWDDQEKIKKNVGGGGGASGSGGGDSSSGGAYNDFSVEYAKTGASKCRGCEDKIAKNLVRISKTDYTSQRAIMYGPQPLWHHVDCFIKNRDELGFAGDMDVTQIKSFKHLKQVDKDELISKIGKGDPKLKRKSEAAGGPDAKKAKTEESKEQKQLKDQNKALWNIRDQLQKLVSKDALCGLLEYNCQALASGESKLLDRVAEIMLFGPFKKCPECKEGQLVYSSSCNAYRCTGDMSEWTKCQYITQKPEKKSFKVPEEYKDVDFLKTFKFVKKDRVFPSDVPMTIDGAVSSASDPSKSAANPDRPLHGMKFVIAGKLSKSQKEVKNAIESLGGKLVSSVDKKTAAVISTKGEVDKMSKLIKAAKECDVHVINEDFLDAVKKGGAVLLITQHSICSWGSDPSTRVQEVTKSVGRSAGPKVGESHFTKNLPDKMKMMVKGGAAVDPESGIANKAHIYQDGSDPMAVVLGFVDLVKGTNSYYKLQLLESDAGSSYWVYRAWGRVGTTIGGNKLESFGGSRPAAVRNFEALYLEKSGNDWSNRKNFKKQAGKMYPLELDYGQDEDEIQSLTEAGSKSKLPKPIQEFVKLIFDIESMKKAMVEFEIDLKKMPLGKLSKNQIEKAYKILSELQKLTESGGSSSKFLDYSNQFYTLIPHDFGMKKPPLLDTAEIIKNKTDMCDNLLDIEVAYSLLKGGSDKSVDPIDAHYQKLNTNMKMCDKKSDEYKRLCDYVKNTHAATHNQYELEVEEIFHIDRHGEKDRFKKFSKLHNRQLLWHGSRATNFAGILSQGLRIAPPEAPVTGYMFGKGVYFADMVSKSANYCRTSRSDPTGILLLCDVALGDMYELTHSEYVTKLPSGKHSTKGQGMTTPNPNKFHTTKDGVVIPMGEGIDSPIRSSLLYNEYIVYDIDQINIKYLLKTKFKWKY